MNEVDVFEQAQLQAMQARQAKEIPDFAPGDTVAVKVRVTEGDRTRLQTFEGYCIGRRSRGLNSTFKVRKVASGVYVEKTFPLHSPLVEVIEVKRRGRVRRAKLYYLRGLKGRAARVRDKQ